jgi:hypothetical protein
MELAVAISVIGLTWCLTEIIIIEIIKIIDEIKPKQR